MTKLRVWVLCLSYFTITLLSKKDFEFVSISRYGDLELVFLFQQLTSIITNVMLHMICCFLATINHICMTKVHRFPSYKLLWDTQLYACNSLFFHKLCLNSYSEVLKCGLRLDIGKSMDELHLFTCHVIHEHGIEISIMLQLLKTIVTNNLVTWGWMTFESIVNNSTGCWHMSYINFWFAVKFYNWCVMCMLCDFQNYQNIINEKNSWIKLCHMVTIWCMHLSHVLTL
jgi:hypothetical protein